MVRKASSGTSEVSQKGGVKGRRLGLDHLGPIFNSLTDS